MWKWVKSLLWDDDSKEVQYNESIHQECDECGGCGLDSIAGTCSDCNGKGFVDKTRFELWKG